MKDLFCIAAEWIGNGLLTVGLLVEVVLWEHTVAFSLIGLGWIFTSLAKV